MRTYANVFVLRTIIVILFLLLIFIMLEISRIEEPKNQTFDTLISISGTERDTILILKSE